MLAVRGGSPVRDSVKNPWPAWPVYGERETELLREVVESRVWSYNGPKEGEFVGRWKRLTGSPHAFLVANGTVSIQLALEALDIGYGDEVIVPGLTWQATAAAVLDVNAVPVLVDVKPDTWCIDPERVAEAVTDRTKAIIPVHLYGSMADMDAILDIAASKGLSVIEDAAHQHGGRWRDRALGTLGDIGSYSLQLSKVLTSGEGGILVARDSGVAARLDALRNCGRRPSNMVVDKAAGQYGTEGDFIQSGNFRITEFQAAILLAQLDRFEEQSRLRSLRAKRLDGLLAGMEGVDSMPADPRETVKAYFKYAFRYDPRATGIPAAAFRSALSAELGLKVESCYEPLNDCGLYRPFTKRRHDLGPAYRAAIDPARFKLPVCGAVYADHAVTLPQTVLLGTEVDLEQIAEAVRKVLENRDSLAAGG